MITATGHQLAYLDRLETERTDVKNNSAWLAQSSRSAALGKTGRLSVHIVVCTTTCDPKDLSCDINILFLKILCS